MPAESEKIQSGTYDIITVELTYDILIVRPQVGVSGLDLPGKVAYHSLMFHSDSLRFAGGRR